MPKTSNREIVYSKRRKGTIEIKPRQADKLNDPRFGLNNLLALIFHEKRSTHLIPVAEQILLYIKEKRMFEAKNWNDFLKEYSDITYSNYQSALQKLRSVGILRREQGIYKLSADFSTFLNTASNCWARFLT